MIIRIFFIGSLLLFSATFFSQKRLYKSSLKPLLSNEKLKSSWIGYDFYNVTKNKTIIAFNNDKNFIPASTLKIITTYSLLKYGIDSIITFYYFFDTDTLHIMPLGDPTFLHKDFKNHKAQTFIKNLNPSVIKIYNHHWKESIWGDGWEWNDYDQAFMPELSPLPIHGNVLLFQKDSFYEKISEMDFINTEHSRIDSTKTFKRDFFSNTFYPKFHSSIDNIPFSTQDNKAVKFFLNKAFNTKIIFITQPFLFPKYPFFSFSTKELVRYYMVDSDNFFSQQLFLQLSYLITHQMNSFELIKKLQNKDPVLAKITSWKDANGLSRRNLIKPKTMIEILKQCYVDFKDSLFYCFPKPGEGTLTFLTEINGKPLFAKTGSMSNTFCLAGYLRQKKKNDLVAFCVYINNSEMTKSDIKIFLTDLLKKML